MKTTNKVIGDASTVPLKPKKVVKGEVVDKRGKMSKTVQEQAVALIEEAFKGAKIEQSALVKRAKDLPATAIVEAIENFETAVGGRERLVSVLQHCPEASVGFNLVQKLLSDPTFAEFALNKGGTEVARYTLTELCYKHKIPLSTVVAAFKDAQTSKLAIEALNTLSEQAQKVVSQVAVGATDRYDVCYMCEGTCRIWRIGNEGEWLLNEDGEHQTQLCHICRGTGKTFKEHDPQNRKLFLQITGILEDKKTPLVQQTFNQANFKGNFLPGDGSLERALKDIDILTEEEKGEEGNIDVPYTIYEASEVEDSPNPHS